MRFTPLYRSSFGRLPEQEGEDLLCFSYQGVQPPQCILLSSIARPLVACQSKKRRTCRASLIKAYSTRNAIYSPPSLELWSLVRVRRGGPVALLLSRRTAPAMHFTPLHKGRGKPRQRRGGGALFFISLCNYSTYIPYST